MDSCINTMGTPPDERSCAGSTFYVSRSIEKWPVVLDDLRSLTSDLLYFILS